MGTEVVEAPARRVIGVPFQPGNPGRPPGPNKLTALVREGLQFAYEGTGGHQGLLRWAQNNPDGFYALLGKLIPQEVKVELGLDEELTKLLGQAIQARLSREL